MPPAVSNTPSASIEIEHAEASRAVVRSIVLVMVCSAVPLLVFCFWGTLDSAFLVPKCALLVTLSFTAAALATAGGIAFRPNAGEPRSGVQWRTWTALLGAYCLAVAVAWLASPRRDMGQQAVLMIIAGPLLGLTIAAVVRGRERLLIAGIAFAGASQVVLALAQWFLDFDPLQLFGTAEVAVGRARLFGTLGDPDSVAIFIAAATPAVLTLALGTPDEPSRKYGRFLRCFWWSIAILTLPAVVGTGCRTGLTGMLLAAAIVVLARRGKRRRRTAVPLSMLAALALVVVLAFSVAIARNPRGTMISGSGRILVWRIGFSQGAWHSMLGSGPGTYADAYALRLGPFLWNTRNEERAIRTIGYLHSAANDFIQAQVETGWLGMLPLLACVAWWLCRMVHNVRAAHARDPDSRTLWIEAAALGGIVALTAAALVESPLQRPESWALFWIWMALPAASTNPPARQQRPGSAGLVLRLFAAGGFALATGWFAAQPVIGSHWLNSAIRAEFRNDYGTAVADYRIALARDPSPELGYFNLARALARQSDYTATLQACDQADLWLHNVLVSRLRAQVLYLMGRRVDAIRAASAGVRDYPWDQYQQQDLFDFVLEHEITHPMANYPVQK